MRKMIFWSLIFFILMIFLSMGMVSPLSSFAANELLCGVSLIFLNLIISYTMNSTSNKNTLNWLKKRLELEEKIGNKPAHLKIEEEIRLLESSPPFRNNLRVRHLFKTMSPEDAEKIGNENGLKKLHRDIKSREITVPFYLKVLLLSGTGSVLVSIVAFLLNNKFNGSQIVRNGEQLIKGGFMTLRDHLTKRLRWGFLTALVSWLSVLGLNVFLNVNSNHILLFFLSVAFHS
jgi:hypothetical protein